MIQTNKSFLDAAGAKSPCGIPLFLYRCFGKKIKIEGFNKIFFINLKKTVAFLKKV